MITPTNAIIITILSTVVGGCVSSAWRNLRGITVYAFSDDCYGKPKMHRRKTFKRPFRGSIYASIGLLLWGLDVIAIFLSVR